MRIGDYRVDRELGTQESCVVYLCLHAVLPRQAAVKVMARGAEPARPTTTRVLQEAYLLESLSTPGSRACSSARSCPMAGRGPRSSGSRAPRSRR